MTSPQRPASVRPVAYKGEPLDAGRGPGLGCFRFQLLMLGVFIVLTPLSVSWDWPFAVSALLLFLTIGLLLFAGQTVIFLLRLVAADRREGRRRPLTSSTRTVGELEDDPSVTPAGASDGVSSGADQLNGGSTEPDGSSASSQAADGASRDTGPTGPGVRE